MPHDQPPARPDAAAAQDDPISLAVELLALTGVPGVGATLVREHTPDRSGRCHGCPHATTPAPRHPCRLHVIGERLVNLGDVTPDTETRRS